MITLTAQGRSSFLDIGPVFTTLLKSTFRNHVCHRVLTWTFALTLCGKTISQYPCVFLIFFYPTVPNKSCRWYLGIVSHTRIWTIPPHTPMILPKASFLSWVEEEPQLKVRGKAMAEKGGRDIVEKLVSSSLRISYVDENRQIINTGDEGFLSSLCCF